MIYRIVKGNGFKLHILVSKLEIAQNSNTLVDCDMNQATNTKVELVDGSCNSIELRHKVSGDAKNELICDFPDDIDIGCYAVKVSFVIGGIHLSSCESNMFAIVPFNRQSKIPVGIIDGEPCGLYNLRYYITTDNSYDYKFWYGSSSANSVSGLNKDELACDFNRASGRTFTIETTDNKPYVWFVCTSPITITQAGLPTAFNMEQVDNLYFYWSDELVAGNDNIYSIGD